MPTINSALRTTAARVPEREALIFEGQSWTYAELDAEVDRVAGSLQRVGFKKGDRFALMAPNSDRFVITFYAAIRAGAIFVPINPASASPEILYILEDSGATVFAFDPSLSDVVAATEAAGLPTTLKNVVCLGGETSHWDLFADTEGGGEGPTTGNVVETDDALIIYTSGTTGNPKGALSDHHRSMWVAVNCIVACGMRDGDRFLHAAPMYHGAELCVMLIPGTLIGATHVVLPRFDPSVVPDALEQNRITMFFGVPTMFSFLVRQENFANRDYSAWRTALFGAAPMSASLVGELSNLLPDVDLIQLCGQTEAGPGGIFCNAEQVRARPDASGRQALPLTEARVVDEHGNDVEPDSVGELLLRGETLMKGYWNKPEETAEVIRDGWLHTGDLARLDRDGYITLVDRLKDMIISGGRNVYSVEVENALSSHPDIADCAIVGRPHPDFGESIVAVVVPNSNATPTLEAIRAHCRGQVAAYKIPHDLILRDEIPRNPGGKILKHVLRQDVSDATRGAGGTDAIEGLGSEAAPNAHAGVVR